MMILQQPAGIVVHGTISLDAACAVYKAPLSATCNMSPLGLCDGSVEDLVQHCRHPGAHVGRRALAGCRADQFHLGCFCCAGAALISVGGHGTAALTRWFAGAMAASPVPSGNSGQLIALASSSADASSINVQLVDAVTGAEVETADVAVAAAGYPTTGPAARIVSVWLDASKRSDASASGSGSSALAGCRLLVLWSDDKVSYVEQGTEAWAREEALASGSSTLMIDLPAALAPADGSTSDGGASIAGPKKQQGVLGLLQDREALKQWVRLQVLSVLIQFRLNSDAEKEEFLHLRSALRCVGWQGEWAHTLVGAVVRGRGGVRVLGDSIEDAISRGNSAVPAY